MRYPGGGISDHNFFDDLIGGKIDDCNIIRFGPHNIEADRIHFRNGSIDGDGK